MKEQIRRMRLSINAVMRWSQMRVNAVRLILLMLENVAPRKLQVQLNVELNMLKMVSNVDTIAFLNTSRAGSDIARKNPNLVL